MYSIDRIISDRAPLIQVEGNNSILKRLLKEIDTKWPKEIKSKDVDLTFLRKEVKDQEEMLKSLHEKFDNQETEMSQLKARRQYLEDQKENGWPDEKKEIQDDYFTRGFNFYLIGFMANDPDYTFENFGEETVGEMAEYMRENALLIKERRIDLVLEDPEKTEDALLENIAHEMEAKLWLRLRWNHLLRSNPKDRARRRMALALLLFKLKTPRKTLLPINQTRTRPNILADLLCFLKLIFLRL